jgi:hypothetical protein
VACVVSQDRRYSASVGDVGDRVVDLGKRVGVDQLDVSIAVGGLTDRAASAGAARIKAQDDPVARNHGGYGPRGPTRRWRR